MQRYMTDSAQKREENIPDYQQHIMKDLQKHDSALLSGVQNI